MFEEKSPANDNFPDGYNEGRIKRNIMQVMRECSARSNQAASLEEKEFWQTRAFKALATLLLLIGVGSCAFLGDFPDN